MKKSGDVVLDFISNFAKKENWIKKVILFGSRARGDSKIRSDFDIAVLIDETFSSSWPKWALSLQENAPTLCGIDVIKIDKNLSTDLRTAIDREGITIYERK